MCGVMGNNEQHDTPNDGWNRQKHKNWSFNLPDHCQPCTSHRRYKLNCSKRHVEKNRRELIIAEALDDQGAER